MVNSFSLDVYLPEGGGECCLKAIGRGAYQTLDRQSSNLSSSGNGGKQRDTVATLKLKIQVIIIEMSIDIELVILH